MLKKNASHNFVILFKCSKCYAVHWLSCSCGSDLITPTWRDLNSNSLTHLTFCSDKINVFTCQLLVDVVQYKQPGLLNTTGSWRVLCSFMPLGGARVTQHISGIRHATIRSTHISAKSVHPSSIYPSIHPSYVCAMIASHIVLLLVQFWCIWSLIITNKVNYKCFLTHKGKTCWKVKVLS